MTDPTLADDALHGDVRVREYFGERYDAVLAFAELLADQGVLRGLIGPREPARLWERHILNSAAVVPFLPPVDGGTAAGSVADVGAGAGLPGLVIAAMEPARPVVLIEPMERRTAWLTEVATTLEMDNVTVLRARAEQVPEVSVDCVTARAVAPVVKLVKWCAPLLAPGGSLALLKGRSAADEVHAARYALRKAGLVARVEEAPTLSELEPTRVVVAVPEAATGSA